MGSPAPQEKASILVADDSAAARKLLTATLRPENHRLLLARDGHEALRIVDRVPELSLVILDVMMPGMDGLEVCRRLRSRKSDRYLPIILATALSDETHLVAGLAAGADDYVTKPFNPTEVVARVRAALRLKRALDQLLGSRELAAVGAIAVTLGHEINNPLTVVIGNLELLARKGLSDGKALTRLQAALEASVRIRALVQRLVSIHKVVITRYIGSVEMLDLGRSCAGDDPAAARETGKPSSSARRA